VSSWLCEQWRWLVVSILAVHFSIASFYSVVNPIWEGPDELGHYRHVRFLVNNLALPQPEDTTTALDQMTHPPLYYAFTALLTSWVDTGDGLKPTRNPFAATGTMEGGANQFVHSDAEAFPYQGTVLAVHAARMVSVLLGALVVLTAYHLGRLLFPQRYSIALGAMAITAFAPSFLFMSSVINNDIMVTLLCSLTLFFSLKVILRGLELRNLFALGVCVGLALLSKYNALALLPVAATSVGLVVVRLIRQRRSLRLPLLGVAALLLSGALVSSWWFLRSMALFGTPTTRSAKIISRFISDLRNPGAGVRRIDWRLLREELSYFYESFWASFGWGNISAESWVYLLLGVLCVAGMAGFVLFLLGKADRSVKSASVLLLLAFVLFSVQATYRTLSVSDPVLRGRYAMPAISGVSVLLALGIVQLTPRRLAGLPILSAGSFMLFLGLLAPFRYIAPVYARPPILTVEEASLEAIPLDFTFGDKLQLVGYQIGVERVKVGEFLPLTLYWRSLSETDENYTIGVSLLDSEGDPGGQVATFPGRGNYATSLWKEGEVVKDSYQVRVVPSYPAPGLARFFVAAYTYPEEEHLAVRDSTAQQIGQAAIFGGLPVQDPEDRQYDVEHVLQYQVGELAALIGYDVDDTLATTGNGCITLYWRALGQTSDDYTVFVHVVDEEGRTISQGDSPPRGGFYPTSYWLEGQTIPDTHCIRVPSDVDGGRYRVYAGIYLMETMQRLPVLGADGQRVRDDRCLVLEGEAALLQNRSFAPAIAQ
jgi:4-amino-4-deoxy-L-arabinose transferase-like glycosyltransferase